MKSYPVRNFIERSKGRYKRVCVCAFDGNTKKLAGKDIARAIKAPDVAVLGGGESAVGSLRSPQAELEQLLLFAGSYAESGGVCADQTGEVDEHQEGGFQQLHDNQGAFDANDWNAREYERSFADRVDLQL